MAQPAALYLTHFDAPPATTRALDLAPQPDLAPIWEPEPEHNQETMLAAEREAGRAEGVEAARAEAAAEAEAMRHAFVEQLAAERAKWLSEESEPLKEKIDTALAQMKEALADSVGQILRPFVIDALRRQMLGELVEHITTLAASHEAIEMKILAPADLIEVLRQKLAELPLAIHYEAREGVDVSVVTGQTMIETRLKTWIDLIGAQLE